jgi:hypothetical protein
MEIAYAAAAAAPSNTDVPGRLGTAGLHEFRLQLADLRLGAPWR